MNRQPANPVNTGQIAVIRQRLDAERNAGSVLTDAAAFLSAAMLLTFLLPGRMVVSGLGAAGRPMMLIGVGLFLWWVLARLVPGLSLTGRQPLRLALAIWFAVWTICYGLGFARGLSVEEASSAERWLVAMVAYAGLTLAVIDGVSTRRRLDAVLISLVSGAGFMAFVAILQNLTGINLAEMIAIPGFEVNGDLLTGRARGVGQTRVAGTATHYIEFGVLMALALPLALHYAITMPTKLKRRLMGVLVAFIGLGSLLAISRSAVLAVGVSFLLILPGWSPRLRFNGLITAFAFLVLVRVTQPGLLGTLLALFNHLDNDPSISGRTDDYAVVTRYIEQRPWLGRGLGTFIPSPVRPILDNQWLGSLIETGVVGVLAFGALFVVGFTLAKRTGRWATRAQDRSLGHALSAAVFSAGLTSGTFDSLGFQGFGAVTFILIGASARLWHLAGQPAPPMGPPTAPPASDGRSALLRPGLWDRRRDRAGSPSRRWSLGRRSRTRGDSTASQSGARIRPDDLVGIDSGSQGDNKGQA